MENNLPSTWEKAALEELASYVIGGDWGKETPERGFERVFVLRGTDYRNWETLRAKGSAVRYFKKQSVEKRQLVAGDIILEVSGGGPDQPVGRVVVIDDKALGSVPGKLSFSNFFRLIRIDRSINPFFVRYYLDHAYLRGDFNEMQSHTTNLRNLRVNEFLKKTDVPVPPRNEQDRIVAKLDELLEKIDRSRARLDRIPKILKRFRLSVLSVAVTGKLSQEWRVKNDYHNEWPVEILGNVVTEIRAGRSIKCVEVPPVKGEVGIVKVSAVSWGEFLEDESKTITDQKFFNREFLIRNGDFLFSRANTKELVGAVVIVKEIKRALMLSDKILRFTLSGKVIPEWILYNLRSEKGRKQIEDLATGNQQSMMNISQGKIREIEFLLPDRKEQVEIVRRVEELFKVADKIEGRYYKAKAQLDKLPQSLLAKAFRGELVGQNPNDEPASVLLDKIVSKKSSPKSPKMNQLAKREYELTEELAIAAEGPERYKKVKK